MARFGRHADIKERGRKTHPVYNFYLECACHYFDFDQSDEGKEASPAANIGTTIRLRSECHLHLLHFPMIFCRGLEETNCGEGRGVRHSTNFAEDHWVLYGFASKILRLCRMVCMREHHLCSSCRRLSHDLLPVRSNP
jgi:hypothetical protein